MKNYNIVLTSSLLAIFLSCSKTELKNGFNLSKLKDSTLDDSFSPPIEDNLKSNALGVADFSAIKSLYSEGCGIEERDINNVFNDQRAALPTSYDPSVFNGAKATIILGSECCYQLHFNNRYNNKIETLLNKFNIDPTQTNSNQVTDQQLIGLTDELIKTHWGYENHDKERDMIVEYAKKQKNDLSTKELSFTMCTVIASAFKKVTN